MVDRSERWDGGYKRTAKNGRKVYVIYARRAGKLYEISTRATSSSAAEEHWRRFQADPEGYRPEGETRRDALRLDTELGRAFLLWSRDDKKNTAKWVRDQRRALAWWQEKLGDADLRAVKTARIVRHLDGVKTGRKQLIATLKTFYGWLRKVRHEIASGEDPMFGTVKNPQANVAQLDEARAVPFDEYAAALAKLTGWHRDALEVLGSTGWHCTELERFARAGRIEEHPRTGTPVLFMPQTKRGNHLRTQVPDHVATAARRLLKAGEAVDYFSLQRAVKNTGATFNPGDMRHSVATWAISAGADMAAVSTFLNHRSTQTTKKFYATHAVPAQVPLQVEVADARRKRARRASPATAGRRKGGRLPGTGELLELRAADVVPALDEPQRKQPAAK